MRKGSAAAADLAADRAFSNKPSLPLSTEAPAEPAAQEGRTRLGGAFSIRLDRIQPDPNQPRERLDPGAVREMANSIIRLGIIQPITVRYLEEQGCYQIITGERRYRGAKLAGLAEIPCWVRSPETRDVLVYQVVENWQRVDLSPLEIAGALAALRDTNGYTQKQLAEITGKSEADISKLLAIVTLSPEAQHFARADSSGTLSRRHLYAAATKVPAEKQRGYLEQLIERQLTADEAEKLAATFQPAATSTAKRGAPVRRIRFIVPKATVLLTFRKKLVTPEDILAALDAARTQAEENPKPPLNIVRPK